MLLVASAAAPSSADELQAQLSALQAADAAV
jgi:hypothetical protein